MTNAELIQYILQSSRSETTFLFQDEESIEDSCIDLEQEIEGYLSSR